MAEIGGMLAAGALKVAAGKLAEAAGDRVMLQWRFKEDLEGMKDTTESIQAVLEDAERQSLQDKSAKLWLERLTRASYDISDMFDEFEVNKTRRKSALRKFKVLNPCLPLSSEVRMAVKMKKIREKLANISKERQNYSFTASNRSNDHQVINDRATSSEVIEAEVLGRNLEKQRIIDLLGRAPASLELIILPIYGIGGIGKTTLAQLLFNDTHFKDYEKAWVYVSQTFDMSKIKEIVRSQLRLEQGQLVANPQEQDAGPSAPMSILIVLDDLWEEDDFKLDELKKSLKLIGNGHKVHAIATTRDAAIAEKVKTIDAHNIQALSADVCWTIIKSKIVGFEGRSDQKRFEDIGMEIAKKCGGVALAAQAIGYILRIKTEFNQWVSVKDSGFWNVSSSSSGSSPYDNVLASLKLSYSTMPPHLRLCFGYCAVFPKGSNMAKDKLIYQWRALGFIKASDGFATWQQLGENCIKQLLEMSFFQRSKSSLIGVEDAVFTMHDLVHDLARLIMGDEILDASTKCNNIGGRKVRYAFLADCSKPLNSFVTCPDKIRALHFLRSGQTGHNDVATYSKKTRALCFLGSDGIRHCPVGFSTAKYLRVLDLANCSLEMLPSSIGELRLLRYLNAPRINDRVIPSCITKLSKLIFLGLRISLNLSELPESIGEMESLMYLDISGCCSIRKLPKSFEKLESLVHLDFSFCTRLSSTAEAFSRLTKLQYLNLSWNNVLALGVLSEVIKNLTEVRYLNLSSIGDQESESWDDFFDSVSTLSNLEHLDLSRNYDFKTIPDSLCSLKKLHTLDLHYCVNLRRLPENMSRMDNLKFLNVKNCDSLDMSTLPITKSSIMLPNFVVSDFEGEKGSNLFLLKDANPHELAIRRLENVRSIEEARRIQLKEKQNLKILTLDWTSGSKGFVEDMELLGALMLPSSLECFVLRGYNNVSFTPAWLKGFACNLTNLSKVTLEGLSQCSSLPPLGQLPNLCKLSLQAMPSLTKIDRGFCGHGMKAFARLEDLTISDMENLEEWTVAYSNGEGAAEEFMFPELRFLEISGCRKLRVRPCPPRVTRQWTIKDSDGVLLRGCGESGPHTGSSTTSAFVRELVAISCRTPMNQWKLLRQLRGVYSLSIHDCSDVSSSPEVARTLVSHPSWEQSKVLGDLVSLERLTFYGCEGLMSFPEFITQLPNLNYLAVRFCPELSKWCEDNKTKIGHIKKRVVTLRARQEPQSRGLVEDLALLGLELQ
ncbi:hypothetical protein EJB05_52890 [Eragrostis curvula]|uniref:NB-ARC domain-containing protein n=1 Tax=Eragrostis curvula TaxID=38414 RepID=A0A5J9SRR7_9POAL|nr:hypothetical protein EJB05_52890 [Eragrostis curvula]